MRRLLERIGNPHTLFRVFTALAFSLFSQEKVDVAVIEAGLGGARDATNVLSNSELAASVITSIGEEHLSALGGSLESIAVAKSGVIKHGHPVVIGGPFDLHIEHIIRERASLMNSPVVSARDPGIQSIVKHFGREDGQAYQTCDILINVRGYLELFIDMSYIKLQMLGNQQLQNAVTAICTTFCLRNQGRTPDIVLLWEVNIAEGRARATRVLSLKDSWVRCALDLGLEILDLGMISKEKAARRSLRSTANKKILLAICKYASVHESVKVADCLLSSPQTEISLA